MSLVLDSSVTLAWCFEDERPPATAELLEEVTEAGAVVPSLWRLEVADALQVAVRRGRIDAAFRDATLDDLALLDVATDADTDSHAWGATVRLAERFALTVYDAAYLELAQRRSLPLATLDGPLRAAAQALGVPLRGTGVTGPSPTPFFLGRRGENVLYPATSAGGGPLGRDGLA